MSSNESTNELTIPSPADFHVHLRQGELMKLVVPHVAEGGIHLAYVMVRPTARSAKRYANLARRQPNLIPPLTIPSQALAYLAELQALAPTTQFLSTLYLSAALTPALIREAHKGGIIGVKSYPRGVTTNSEGGVGMEGYAVFDDVFGEMEKCGMVLNLHGEVPSDLDGDVSLRSSSSNAVLMGVLVDRVLAYSTLSRDSCRTCWRFTGNSRS